MWYKLFHLAVFDFFFDSTDQLLVVVLFIGFFIALRFATVCVYIYSYLHIYT